MRASVNFRKFNWNDRPQIQMVGLYDRAHYLVSSSGLVNPRHTISKPLTKVKGNSVTKYIYNHL